jgi:hypothetical protein
MALPDAVYKKNKIGGCCCPIKLPVPKAGAIERKQ